MRTPLSLLGALALMGALVPVTAASAIDDSTGVWINEFHYDNAGTDEGEFIEVAVADDVDLGGWSIVRYNGANGGVYGDPEAPAEDDLGLLERTGAVDRVEFVVVEYPVNGLQNGAPDGFALVDTGGEVVQFLSYEGTFAAVDGPAAGMTSTDVGVQQTGATTLDPIGASLQLTGTGASYADFTWTRTQVNTAGQLNTNQEFVESGDPTDPPPSLECDFDDITRIHTIQGSSSSSPLAGDTVTVEAVVTLVEPDLGGFFVQEAPENEDDDPATSEGLFVEVAPIPEGTEPASTVQVTGTVLENFGRTQLEPTSVAVCDADPVVIAPVALPLPSSPTEREPFENMLVTASDLVVSGSFSAYQFGELITGHEGELFAPTQVATPGVDADAASAETKAREVILDDRSAESFINRRSVWEQDPERRLGDRIPEVTGVLDYTFGNFKIQYTEFPEIGRYGAPEVPRLDEGNDLAVFNVLNYFNEFGSDNRLRGARNQEQFDVQSAKIVSAILELDPTVLGLVELQNDYRDEFDGDPGTEPSVATLVGQLNATAGVDGLYDYVRIPEEQLATEGLNGGGVGTDAIANGIIFQPARATQVGTGATFDIDAELSGDSEKNRWPFAASFDIDGEVVTVAVNHFKSKSAASNCLGVVGPDFEAGEDVTTDQTGSCDLTRRYAAERLVEWMDTDPTGVDDGDVFLVGDFNSYAREAPIEILKSAGYLDTVEEFDDGAFTYKFNGRVGTLDYVFASASAAEKVDDAEAWQINSRASYPDLYFVDPIDLTGPKGSSDHDPLVVSLLAADTSPEPGVPTQISQCKDGGWRTYQDPSFRNQGACVSFVASGALRGPVTGTGR